MLLGIWTMIQLACRTPKWREICRSHCPRHLRNEWLINRSQGSSRLVHLNYLSREKQSGIGSSMERKRGKKLTGNHKSAETELWCPLIQRSSFVAPQFRSFHLHLHLRSKSCVCPPAKKWHQNIFIKLQRGARQAWTVGLTRLVSHSWNSERSLDMKWSHSSAASSRQGNHFILMQILSLFFLSKASSVQYLKTLMSDWDLSSSATTNYTLDLKIKNVSWMQCKMWIQLQVFGGGFL